jgi:hypothetical protein
MGRLVIAAYRPKPGRAAELEALARTHVEILRGQSLATDHPVTMMTAADGTVVEVFEWVSSEAIQSAHTNPVVLELWGRYAEVCEYVPFGTLAEAQMLFAEFSPIEG